MDLLLESSYAERMLAFLDVRSLFQFSAVTARAPSAIESFLVGHCATIDLHTSWRRVDDQVIVRLLRPMRRIRSLCLRGCYKLTDDALHVVQSQLVVLDLARCTRLTDSCVAVIAHVCKELESLSLCSCAGISDLATRSLRECPRLNQLDLSHVPRISDVSFHFLTASIPGLPLQSWRTLRFSHCIRITSLGLGMLASHTTCTARLQTLDLAGCSRIEDSGTVQRSSHAYADASLRSTSAAGLVSGGMQLASAKHANTNGYIADHELEHLRQLHSAATMTGAMTAETSTVAGLKLSCTDLGAALHNGAGNLIMYTLTPPPLTTAYILFPPPAPISAPCTPPRFAYSSSHIFPVYSTGHFFPYTTDRLP
jgi:hypothetical protein